MAKDRRELFAAIKAEAARYTPGTSGARSSERTDIERLRRESIAAQMGARPWLDGVKEICARAGIGRTTLWRYLKRGFPVRRVEGRLVALQEDVDSWMTGRFGEEPRPRHGRPRKNK